MDLVFSTLVPDTSAEKKRKISPQNAFRENSDHMKTFTLIKITDSCRVGGSFIDSERN